MNIREVLARKLREFRNRNKMTTDEVGEIVGKSGKTISAWENGRGQPDADMLIKLCDVYGITCVSEFFDEHPKEESISRGAQRLAIMYDNELNSAGQEKLLDYADDLVGNSKYKKGKSASKKDEKTFPAMEISSELMDFTQQIFQPDKKGK